MINVLEINCGITPILFKNDTNQKNAFQGRLTFGCAYHG